MIKELHYKKLKRFIQEQDLHFETTEEIDTGDRIVGQERAAKALQFGLRIKSRGYNIYVAGLPGTGKTTFAKEFALELAKDEPTPPDLCYIYNFQNPKCPKILYMPPGQGLVLKEEMADLIARLEEELPKAFNNKEYENKKAEIVKGYQGKRDELIKLMTVEAKVHDFGVKTTNTGIYFMPIVNGEVISEEQYDELDDDTKNEISIHSESIQSQAADVMRSIREYEKSTRKEVEDLEYSVGLFTVGRHIGPLIEKYADNESVLSHLLAVKEDILENIEGFVDQSSDEDEALQSFLPWYGKKNPEESFAKYDVNVIWDNSRQNGAPVVVDYNPTYSNLVGEIEYDNEYGNLTTDFMKIKPGLFHQANGGYLILQAHDVLTNMHVWETVRRLLLTRQIITEPLREYSTGVAVSGIRPEPVDVDLKIILVGTAYFYELLYIYDDEFKKLFKILAEFDYEMNGGTDNMMETARFIKKMTHAENLMQFHVTAVAKVLEYSSRLAERQDKLTTRFNQLSEVLVEANAWAKMENAERVQECHVTKAIDERTSRLNLYEEKLSEMIDQNIILIHIQGAKIGQLNGLAVLEYGEYTFAKPSRITATTYVGKAGIVNIEKEADMSGRIHEKGIQVLTGFLGHTYAQKFPLSLSCRICFEQNYSGIDGDSASSTELYAILSSLAELPLRQEIAVTGSMNQWGEIQPIGGATYKIEGFFDLCQKKGLTGKQGVIIPVQNVGDLVLKDSVIQAVKDGLFHIYPVSHVDEGIEILTGMEAGTCDERGKFGGDTVHGRVYRKLKGFYKRSIAE